ncbi:hypothetical protein CERSUDRAFT_95787 [Gelatoporia subvermispora B]|uniref:Uncharacterized protein n=1 Tax=Ceriporiopsis subvermispora (strain B) TaxID=914234 RepID=M2RDI1_CERS8|nr:hypothetical protein CERSUDRAFT_95787 [Gelatoporia subvermispora B]
MAAFEAALARDEAAEENSPPELQSCSIQVAHASKNSPRAEMSAEEQSMWHEYEVHGAEFDGGLDVAQEERRRIETIMDVMALWNAGIPDEPETQPDDGPDNCEEEQLEWERYLQEDEEMADVLADQDAEQTAEELQTSPEHASKWFPYPNKTVFLLDVLTNLPRLRVTDALMRVFLWILREIGARNVLSFSSLRKFQDLLRKTCSVPTKQYTSPKANIFYYNDPRVILAKDWSTPEIRREMRVYPVIPKGPVTEIWHADKFRKKMNVDMLSLMYDTGQGRHFYVRELAQLEDGHYVIPIRWLELEQTGEIVADAFLPKSLEPVKQPKSLQPVKQPKSLGFVKRPKSLEPVK